MRSRVERINAADQKAVELENAENELSSWIAQQHKALVRKAEFCSPLDISEAVYSPRRQRRNRSGKIDTYDLHER